MNWLLFFVWMLPLIGHSSQQVNSLYEIKLEQIQKDSLILIDIGGTLLQHNCPLSYKKHKSWVEQWCMENASHLSADEIKTLILQIKNENDSWVLTDSDWPLFIEKAKLRGASVVAFSKLVPIADIRQKRLARIKALSIELSNDLSLERGTAFLYEKGVIEIRSNLKGSCLKEVIGSLKQIPSQIVCIENEEEQIKSIEEVCLDLDIPCLSFHYTGAKIPDLNPELADKKLFSIVKNNYCR